jgi:hypothetical protein
LALESEIQPKWHGLYTSTVAPTYPLSVDTSLYPNGVWWFELSSFDIFLCLRTVTRFFSDP